LLCELAVEPHPATTVAANAAAPTTMSAGNRLGNPPFMFVLPSSDAWCPSSTRKIADAFHHGAGRLCSPQRERPTLIAARSKFAVPVSRKTEAGCLSPTGSREASLPASRRQDFGVGADAARR
jgi:hypothetical protein